MEMKSGQRYLAYARSATNDPEGIANQLAVIRQFADSHGLCCAGEVTENWMPRITEGEAVGRLVQRKVEQGDFELLVATDMNRLTRAGGQHGPRIMNALRDAGITPVFVHEPQLEQEFRSLVDLVETHSQLTYTRQLALSTARGRQTALLERRIPHVSIPPFGVDRLFTDKDGNPHYVLRRTGDGYQVQLDPQTGNPMQPHLPSLSGLRRRHYRKQDEERVTLVPGAAECVAVVKHIFMRYYGDGQKPGQIVRELGERFAPTPSSTGWNVAAVRRILRNPIYIGIGIANRRSYAVFIQRGSDQLIPDDQSAQFQQRPRLRWRPPEEWLLIEYPALVNAFVDPSIRDRVWAQQQAWLGVGATPAKLR